MPAIVESSSSGVVIILLNRPERRNALSLDLLRTVNDELGRRLRAGRVSAVVLRGAGGYFSAGADLQEMAAARGQGAEGRARLQRAMAELIYLMTNLHTLPLPTFALIDGGASGGGVGLAASCQWVIASAGAELRLPEATLGLFPFMIAPVLIRRLGLADFLRMALRGPALSAGQAAGLGLVDEVVARLPASEELGARQARPEPVWPPGPGEEDLSALLAEYSDCPAHLLEASRKAALLHSSMPLPLAMRTGALELGALLERAGERP